MAPRREAEVYFQDTLICEELQCFLSARYNVFAAPSTGIACDDPITKKEKKKELWRQGQDMVNQLWFDLKCFEIPIVYVLSKVLNYDRG